MTQDNLIVSRKKDIRRIHKSLQWIGIILVMIALTACGGGGGGSSDEDSTPNTSANNTSGGMTAPAPTAPAPNAPPPPPPPAPVPPAPTMPPANDQQIFATTVHPLMTGNNCVQCHSDPTPLGLTPILPLMPEQTP